MQPGNKQKHNHVIGGTKAHGPIIFGPVLKELMFRQHKAWVAGMVAAATMHRRGLPVEPDDGCGSSRGHAKKLPSEQVRVFQGRTEEIRMC